MKWMSKCTKKKVDKVEALTRKRKNRIFWVIPFVRIEI